MVIVTIRLIKSGGCLVAERHVKGWIHFIGIHVDEKYPSSHDPASMLEMIKATEPALEQPVMAVLEWLKRLEYFAWPGHEVEVHGENHTGDQ